MAKSSVNLMQDGAIRIVGFKFAFNTRKEGEFSPKRAIRPRKLAGKY